MSVRTPLPLRWLQPPLAAGSSNESRLLSVYKPSGLPYFSLSQVSASPNPQRLFSAPYRGPNSSSEPASGFVSTCRPHDEDTSDSLSARLNDGLSFGATPFLTLPLPSSLLLQQRGHRSQRLLTSSAVNTWTSRYKGVSLVSLTQRDAVFTRNAYQMGFVSHTFQVLVRLPPGVAQCIQQHTLQESQRRQSPTPFLNPLVREAVERQSRREAAEVDGGGGVERGESGGPRITHPTTGLLPSSLRREALLEGSLVDWRAGRLRSAGSLSGFLRPATPLPADVEEAVRVKRRLAKLFIPPSSRAGRGGSGSPPEEEEEEEGNPHPWMTPAERLVVSVDAPAHGGTRRGVRGKAVTLWYRLLAVGSHRRSDVALYHVRGSGSLSYEDVAALFSAEGFYPINDYVNDRRLASVVAKAAEEVRRGASPSLLSSWPVALQHRLQSSSPEELVALPLMRQPLLAADAWAVSQLEGEVQQYASLRLGMLAHGGGDAFLDRLKRSAAPAEKGRSSGGLAKREDLVGHLLYSSLTRSKALTDGDFHTLMCLSLGPGLTCVGIAFPDPGNAATVLAMQHAMLRFEEGRLEDSQREELQQSMRYIQAGASMAPSGLFSSSSSSSSPSIDGPAAYGGSVSVPRGWTTAPVGLQSSSPASATGAAEDVAFSYALALTSPIADRSKEPTAREPPDEAETKVPGAAPPVVDLTEVPLAYTALWRWWRGQRHREDPSSALPSRGELHSLVEAAAKSGRRESGHSEPNAKPTRTAEVAASAAAEGDDNDNDVDGSGDKDGRPAPHLTPLFVRVEELGAYYCTSCGGEGHVWQCCPLTSMTALDTLPSFAALEEPQRSSQDGAGKRKPPLPFSEANERMTKDAPKDAEGTVSQQEVPTTADDVADLMAMQEEQRAQTALALGGNGGEYPTAILSVAPTSPPNLHAMRRERQKPVMQRRAVRCAYCHGRHHISCCPKLQDGADDAEAVELLRAVQSPTTDGEAASAEVSIDRERVRREPEGLFCIRCGAYGHLYTHCPTLPEGLHPATHCSICLQSFQRIHHTPMRCPRRVSLPSSAAFFANGIPRAYVRHDSDKGGGRRSAKQRSLDGPRRARAGKSVLMADSFVDQL